MATALAAACGDQGPASAPGELTATIRSPNGVEGSALVILAGAGLGAVGPVEGRVFAEATGDTVRVVVVSLDGGALAFTVRVSDTTRLPVATLVEVAGPDDRLRALAGYAVEIHP